MKSLDFVITAREFKIAAPALDFQAVMRERESVRFKTGPNGRDPRLVTSGSDDLVMVFAVWSARRR